ncbi:MAG: hypothetical protein LUG92_04875 [Oscillospiraceae bacterium]|nr:hypothetical protein [Oscillospiraceae bacterium]
MKKRSKPKHPLRAVLTVAPVGTATTPEGQPAEPASAAKRFAAKAVHYTIGWAKFLF